MWFKNITPTKFFDSLAFGVPVIVSDMGGLNGIIEQYNCGIVVDEQNPKSVADAMETMIKHPEQRALMRVQGLKAIKEQFNWDRMKEKLLNTYDMLLS